VVSASNNRATTFGSPEAGSIELTVYDFDYAEPTPGYLNDDQYALWYGENEETTAEPETTTTAPETTPEPETTTAEPEDTEPVTTTTTSASEESKTPETTDAAPKKKSCGSSLVAPAIMSVVALAGTVLLRGKKRYTK
jgi:hypothetical protein